MTEANKKSLSFVLRLWAENVASPTGNACWRASLDDARTGQRRGFASLEQLFVFLMEATRAAESPSPPPAASPGAPASTPPDTR
jgi:hypothetical protein